MPTARTYASVPHHLLSHLKNTSASQIAHTPFAFSRANLGITSILLRHGLISNITLGDQFRADPALFRNLAPKDRRIWITMKYRAGLPVLRELSVVSRGSQRVNVDRDELGRMLMGCRAKGITGVGMGEILVLRVPYRPNSIFRHHQDKFMDGWEAWRSGSGGEIVARAA